ncbi:MAG: ComF family protein [Eubacterium ramulus]
MQGAFSVKCALPPNACILLVDDIYTTGSTVDEAARCLQAAGECKVYVAAVAIGG